MGMTRCGGILRGVQKLAENWGRAGPGQEASLGSAGLGAGVRGVVSQDFSVSVSLPLLLLVMRAQLVFLTVPESPGRENAVMNTQRRGAVCVWEGGCGRRWTGMPPAAGRGLI